MSWNDLIISRIKNESLTLSQRLEAASSFVNLCNLEENSKISDMKIACEKTNFAMLLLDELKNKDPK